MREMILKIEPFCFSKIIDCRIEKCINQHFTAEISGYINQEEEERITDFPLNKTVHINAQSDTGEVYSIFKGYVYDMSIEYNGDLRNLKIRLKSNTGKLDIKSNKIRGYQGEKQTYRQIIDTLRADKNEIQVIYSDKKNILTDGLVVQYRETDWEFINRLAIMAGTVIVPDCTNDFICFYFGIPRKKRQDLPENLDYRVRRYMDCFGMEQEEIQIVSRDYMELCEPVIFQEKEYLVYSISSRMERNELNNYYSLRMKDNFKSNGKNNREIAGTSLSGRVIQIKRDKVRIRLHCDEEYDYGNRLWFYYATVYSSPDGTGWYCMPEMGDQIRLQFPDSDDRNAYVISSVHIQDKRNLRKNPDEKSFRTKHDKEIRFTPNQILITNHDGLSISLDDRKGIRIQSDKDVTFLAEEALNIQCGGAVQISAEKGVYLQENQNLLMIRNGIKEKAMRIEHN